MKTLLGRLAAAGALVTASAAPLLAQSYGSCVRYWSCSTKPRAVPEIDATTGVLAVAAVLAVLAFVWERRRRA